MLVKQRRSAAAARSSTRAVQLGKGKPSLPDIQWSEEPNVRARCDGVLAAANPVPVTDLAALGETTISIFARDFDGMTVTHLAQSIADGWAAR